MDHGYYMGRNSHVNGNLRLAAFHPGALRGMFAYMASNHGHGSNKRRRYFREHRLKKGYTQRQVVGRLELMGGDLPTTAASLSRIETGKQVYGEPIIEALAEIYEVEPWELIGNDPTKAGEVVFMGDFKPDEIARARAVLDALKKTAT